MPIAGSCFCGATSYTVSGTPTLSAPAGSPCIWTIHFPAAAFSWTTNDPQLDSYVTEGKQWKTRYRCKACGCCVGSVWGTQLERDENGVTKDYEIVKPTAHIFYSTAIIAVGEDDGLGKWEGYESKSTHLG
ncbi:hypothetical protein C8F01DRAFT_1206404 [Mycena amicta]|nr:hypothetical protein C8F01DRAFT_1206404 [Mycena amicta]